MTVLPGLGCCTLIHCWTLLAILGGGETIKVPGTGPLPWEVICCEYSDVSKKPSTPPERAIKHEIDLLLDSVPPAER